jgi:hypothetical protein
MPSYDRALWALRGWLDSWSGIGRVAVGWRATFYTTGMEHSPTSAIGTNWEKTPWRAVQRAAWEALRRPT